MIIANAILLGNKKGSGDSRWWLANGVIPESDTYTIYDPLAANDLATSYVNLANPGTRDVVPGVAPTHSQGVGWTFNGTSQYLDSQKPFLANDTLVIWCDRWQGIYVAGNTKIQVRPINNPNSRFTITTNTDLTGISISAIIGMSAQLPIYRNGKAGGNMGSFTVSGTNYNTFIGCRNDAGSPLQYGSGNVLRYAHYDFKLSDAQQIALFESMRSYQLPNVDSYSASILALNPICYYPLNQKYGGYALDISGNGANAVSRLLANVGVSGLKGNAIQGTTTAGRQLETIDNWAALTGANLDEFSVSMLIKNINADTQGRPINIWTNGGTDYLALEIRSGNIAVYCRENGVAQNSGALATTTNDTWHHLVFYNSLSNLEFGIYLDGVRYNAVKTLGGHVDTSPDLYYPYICQSMSGLMQHVAFFNRALSQGEVNSINPIT